MTTAVPAPAGFPHPLSTTTGRAPTGGTAPGGGLPAARTADPDGTVLRIDAAWLAPLRIDAPGTGAARPDDPDAEDVRGRTAVLHVHGEIDLLTGGELRAALHAWLQCGAGTVVVDLRGVSFVDCAGVGLLVEARRHADRAGIRLRVVPGRVVARTAALLDLAAALGLG